MTLQYKFILPPWMILIVRAVITLDGFAARCDPSVSSPGIAGSAGGIPGSSFARDEVCDIDPQGSLSAVEAALPHAVQRIFSPTTAEGRATLRRAILDDDGQIAWDRLAQVQ